MAIKALTSCEAVKVLNNGNLFYEDSKQLLKIMTKGVYGNLKEFSRLSMVSESDIENPIDPELSKV